MIELLRYANRTKVAAALGVSPQSTSQWAKGRDVTPFRLRQVEDLLRPQRAGEADPTNGELLTEMRAIRRLLQRQMKPAPELTLDQIVSAVGSVVDQRLAAGPATGSRTPGGAGARRRKAVPRVGAAR